MLMSKEKNASQEEASEQPVGLGLGLQTLALSGSWLDREARVHIKWSFFIFRKLAFGGRFCILKSAVISEI